MKINSLSIGAAIVAIVNALPTNSATSVQSTNSSTTVPSTSFYSSTGYQTEGRFTPTPVTASVSLPTYLPAENATILRTGVLPRGIVPIGVFPRGIVPTEVIPTSGVRPTSLPTRWLNGTDSPYAILKVRNATAVRDAPGTSATGSLDYQALRPRKPQAPGSALSGLFGENTTPPATATTTAPQPPSTTLGFFRRAARRG